MLKRKIMMISIIALTITLVIVSGKYINLLEYHNWQQTNANISFKSSLSVASSAFKGNALSDEKYKNYNYNNAMSKIASASMLFQFTEYAKNNNGLDGKLDILCSFMEQNKYEKIIIQKSKQIYESLFKLSFNPENKQATDNLTILIEEVKLRK
jgi:hypothetical protein